MSQQSSVQTSQGENKFPPSIYRPHEGKLAIVTGGSRGIGAATARHLARQGANLLLIYTSDSSTEPTQNLCRSLNQSYNIDAKPIQADLSRPADSVSSILDAARNMFTNPKTKHFQVDILINNAGIASNQLLNDPKLGPIDPSEFERVYAVNVLAPLLLTQAVAPYLPKDRSGRIVNVSSISSSIGYEGQSIYAGTKAALEAMTRSWSRELALNATVNAVNPGPVWGDMYAGAGETFWKQNQKYMDTTPLSRYSSDDGSKVNAGETKEQREDFDKLVTEKMGGMRPAFVEEIAGTIGMLCLPEAGWTTGSVVCANGGAKMSIA